jgi:hypothetical protein
MKKLYANLALQLLNCLGYRRPLESEPICRPSEPACIDNRDEDFHRLQHVHSRRPCTRGAIITVLETEDPMSNVYLASR